MCLNRKIEICVLKISSSLWAFKLSYFIIVTDVWRDRLSEYMVTHEVITRPICSCRWWVRGFQSKGSVYMQVFTVHYLWPCTHCYSLSIVSLTWAHKRQQISVQHQSPPNKTFYDLNSSMRPFSSHDALGILQLSFLFGHHLQFFLCIKPTTNEPY